MGDILTSVAAILASVGGAGAIILGFSNWLGKIWADRFMQSERQRHAEALELLRSEASKEIERLRHSHQSDMDVLLRRRKVYERIATDLRIFLPSAGGRASDQEKRRFLRAYDMSFLWASDEVALVVRDFLDANIAHAEKRNPRYPVEAQEFYARCLAAMRRDAGFPNTAVDETDYRVVGFPD